MRSDPQNASPETFAQAHAKFIVGLRYDDLPPAAVTQATSMLVDGVACGFAAITSPIARALQAWTGRGGGEHRVFGDPTGTDARSAVLANGTLIHALDFDDIPHFAAVEVPPALAIIEDRDVSGEELIVAIVAGFEVCARVTTMLAHGRPQHPIGTAGAIGATAVAARRLGLDGEQTATALSIAASMSSGLTENFGTFTKPFHAGRAAEAGYTAATLAAAGWTADVGVYEGRKGYFAAYCDPNAHVEREFGAAEDDFWITRVPADLSAGSPLDEQTFPPVHRGGGLDVSRVGLGAPSDQLRGGPNLSRGPSFKPWPACGGNNAVLTAMFSLIHRGDVAREDIERVEIVVPTDPERGAVFRTRPKDALQGKFSLPYGVAAAWLDGEVTVASYEDDTFQRIMSRGLLDRISIRIEPAFIQQAETRPDLDDCNWAAVVVTLADGTVHTSWAFNRGVEMGAPAVDEKFLVLTTPFLGDRAEDTLRQLRAISSAPSAQAVLAPLMD